MFERESRREKILEVRNREIRLKMKTKTSQMVVADDADEEVVKSAEDLFADQHVRQAEKEFYEYIRKETTPEAPPPPPEDEEGREFTEDETPTETESPPPPTPEPEVEPKKEKKEKKKKKKKK